MAVSEKSVGTKRNSKSAGNGARKSAASQKTAAKQSVSSGKRRPVPEEALETAIAGQRLPEEEIRWKK